MIKFYQLGFCREQNKIKCMLNHEIRQYCIALSYSSNWLTSVAQMYIASRDNSSAPDELEWSKLDRRRLSSAHFKYAILQVASWYPGDLNVSDIVFSTDVYQTLLDFTRDFKMYSIENTQVPLYYALLYMCESVCNR